ncbi:MAG: sulfite exporter TauE/SafE family protein [Moritella sp.]|uniref:sulfite exporter TauE/SafE family protein n=1 Tax=Moritella sp. TaxID=78556 RepID=UPI0025EF8544|nr:sulfite exporter TauE/SafE family protein [Moritella sp.]NQZ90718.1 sulfite exporter TauE/SafE family protein [Moritella sp.]
MIVVLYLVLGAAAGLIAGLFGVGGGLIIVPALIFSFNLQDLSPLVLTQVAIGTSLATIIFTSLSSIKTHHSKGAIDWSLVKRLTFGIVIGAVLGSIFADYLPGETLQMIIGIYALIVAVQMGLNLKPKAEHELPTGAGLSVAGGIIGAISALFGIGGGSLTVPYLSWCRVEMRNAVATSSACGLPIAVAGMCTYVITGWNNPELPEYSLGYIYLPAFFGIIITSTVFAKQGAKLAHSLPSHILKRYFALLLLGVGSKFIFF